MGSLFSLPLAFLGLLLSLASTTAGGENAETLITQGDQLDKALKAKEALEFYLPANKLEPDNVDLLICIARQYRHLMSDTSSKSGISAVTSNMREAQQFSVWFTFLTFIPFYLLPTLIGHPGAPLAVALSLIPPTAPVSTMLRLTAPSSAVPAWQIGLSLALLAAAGWFVLRAAARIFRVGLLMYGKTPSLPEILRWATRA